MKMKLPAALAVVTVLSLNVAVAQKAYFIDGYHGGVWGHYPDWNTRFMTDQLKQHPDWKINLEIEPETWDKAQIVDPEAYAEFKALLKDQSSKSMRAEYVNPAYGQSYMYNISGESIISQLFYGMKKLKTHFPEMTFSTYSSEEPCFTSALPQILKSFGFKYASLKNPNTCWGGYTRANGGELVNWIGPDGTAIRTSPRYAVEDLEPGSNWQTIAWRNHPDFINAAFKAGMPHPTGMTLQDAGWRNGPYLGDGKNIYQPTEYTTWRNYFENVSAKDKATDWHLTQEDVLVSLVWGAQVTQRIAQQVRTSENKIVATEKLAAISKIYNHTQWPAASFEKAWQKLLLSQHHDCWIVPYNGRKGDTWADKVVGWTGFTNQQCDSIAASVTKAASNGTYIKVYNTLGINRNETVSFELPAGWQNKAVAVLDRQGKEIASQLITDPASGTKKILFKADVPSIGFNTYQLVERKPLQTASAKIVKMNDGRYSIETDLYQLVLDPAKGGTIQSLVAKTLDGKQFVDKANQRSFNELRGNFYDNGGFKSSTDKPAVIEVIDNGPLRVTVQVKGTINETPFTQTISLTQGQPKIDIWLKIDWKENVGIGRATAQGTYSATGSEKAFYDDQSKLLTLFPLNLQGQKVYKNAPFDVLQSRLDNAFFTRWDSIKNNIIVNWVDVTDQQDAYGMAMFTDHTTNYTHGKDFPLGLTIQYSGVGLWGRNYTVDGPTQIHYALMPHKGRWDKSAVWTAGTQWNEPLMAVTTDTKPSAADSYRSLVHVANKGVEISNITFDGDDMLVRLFNAEGDSSAKQITIDGNAKTAALVELNGDKKQALTISKSNGKSMVTVSMPRFGIRTIRLSGLR